MASARFNQIDWAGIVLGVPGGQFIVYQVYRPEGHLTVQYHHDMDRGFWDIVTKPVIVDQTLEVYLTGSLMTWDGQQRPNQAAGPLALPPTPGYTEISSTRPAIDR